MFPYHRRALKETLTSLYGGFGTFVILLSLQAETQSIT